MAYNFDIQYRSTSAHGNADALSRLPVGTDPDFDKEEEACLTVVEVSPPINSELIRNHMDKDKVLKQVLQNVSVGWPEKLQPCNEALLPYFNRKFALTINKQLLCLHKAANRIIIPAGLRAHILKLLHEGHWGMVRMKQLARQHVRWPTIEDDIRSLAQSCSICKCNNPAPPREYQSWPAATTAWERIHIDFAGSIFDAMWLICVDAYSQFPFVIQMSSTTSANTIAALSSIFAIEGYPKTMVSDNGPQLTADAFEEFCKLHGITYITTAPFHPASKGLAERFLQSLKFAVKKNLKDGINLNLSLEALSNTLQPGRYILLNRYFRNTRLTFEELATADADDAVLAPLTPGPFLVGYELRPLPEFPPADEYLDNLDR
ncbi:uncharacterized protein K02A2.6-like [Drosophila gunungcola]|uniref:uncharacterized protein K02A2.6-like n=1 Tax=Drosophila gunungcola TaxID=103775 RepID=UPI0022E404CF|nr:uncharacterized protein K02A2.6-like [Drosophila gunungcola]